MKPIFRYGILLGIIIGLWGICSFSLVDGINKSFFHGRIRAANIRSVSGLFGALILIVGIYSGIRKTREIAGSISFGAAVKTGVGIALISAALVTVFTFLYVSVVNPGYTGFMVSDAASSMAAAGKKPEEINLELIKVRRMFSPGMQVVQAFTGQLFAGIIASLILGATMRSRKSV